jgi:dienelactone hydrolase
MSFEERKRLEQEDGEPLHVVRLSPDLDVAVRCKGAGVLVVAGEHGLTRDVEARVMKPLAELGFFVAGIDLVRDRRGLDHALAYGDISTALLYLKEMASGKLGVIGFDSAGGIVMEAACVLPQIDAVVHASGAGPRKGTKLARTRASMVIHRGAKTSPLTVEQCADMLDRIRPSRQTLLTYNYDATDGFVLRPADADEEDLATIALDRTRDFLTERLL